MSCVNAWVNFSHMWRGCLRLYALIFIDCLCEIWKIHFMGWRILRWPQGGWQSSFRGAENNGRLMVPYLAITNQRKQTMASYMSPHWKLQGRHSDLLALICNQATTHMGNSLKYATREEATGICLFNNGQWFSKVMSVEPRRQLKCKNRSYVKNNIIIFMKTIREFGKTQYLFLILNILVNIGLKTSYSTKFWS